MAFSFEESIKTAKKDYGLNTGTWKISEGDNKVRLVTPFLPVESEYQGTKSVKFWGYLIDRKIGTIELARLPYAIIKIVSNYQRNPDYEFSDLPMPYDITITAKGAGTKEVEYGVIPARQNTPLTESEKEIIEKLDIESVVKKMREKNGQNSGGESEELEDIRAEDLPF